MKTLLKILFVPLLFAGLVFAAVTPVNNMVLTGNSSLTGNIAALSGNTRIDLSLANVLNIGNMSLNSTGNGYSNLTGNQNITLDEWVGGKFLVVGNATLSANTSVLHLTGTDGTFSSNFNIGGNETVTGNSTAKNYTGNFTNGGIGNNTLSGLAPNLTGNLNITGFEWVGGAFTTIGNNTLGGNTSVVHLTGSDGTFTGNFTIGGNNTAQNFTGNLTNGGIGNNTLMGLAPNLTGNMNISGFLQVGGIFTSTGNIMGLGNLSITAGILGPILSINTTQLRRDGSGLLSLTTNVTGNLTPTAVGATGNVAYSDGTNMVFTPNITIFPSTGNITMPKGNLTLGSPTLTDPAVGFIIGRPATLYWIQQDGSSNKKVSMIQESSDTIFFQTVLDDLSAGESYMSVTRGTSYHANTLKILNASTNGASLMAYGGFGATGNVVINGTTALANSALTVNGNVSTPLGSNWDFGPYSSGNGTVLAKIEGINYQLMTNAAASVVGNYAFTTSANYSTANGSWFNLQLPVNLGNTTRMSGNLIVPVNLNITTGGVNIEQGFWVGGAANFAGNLSLSGTNVVQTPNINFIGSQTITSGGVIEADFGNGYLNHFDGNISIDWFSRLLKSNNGTVGIYWGTDNFVNVAANATFNGTVQGANLSTFTSYASGTPWVLTTTTQEMAFGTANVTVTIPYKGNYTILATAKVKENGATLAGVANITLQLYRKNNTPGNLTNALVIMEVPVITTLTGTFQVVSFPPILYRTSNTTDIITMNGSISSSPGAGNITVDAASLMIMPAL